MTPPAASAQLPSFPAARGATTLLLVRHAESRANAQGETEQDTDSPLTKHGQQQAQYLAEAFRQTHVRAIVCSDTQRARDTVAPLAEARGLTVVEHPALREPRSNRRPAHFVDAAQASALLERLRTGQLPPPPPPAETHAEVVARLRDLITTLPAEGPVVICSHYVTLNVLVRLLIDANPAPSALWAHFANASVTRVDLPASRHPPVGILTYLNWVPPGA